MSDVSEYRRSVLMDMLLTLVTCGIYGLYWQYRLMKGLNALLGEQKHNFLKWLLLTTITCGIWHIYVLFVMSQDMNNLQGEHSIPPTRDLPVISLILSIVGFPIAVEAILQHLMNEIIEAIVRNARPPGVFAP